jgi:prepilin-type N-terminal cleavage/methylation domain-containing protein
MLKIINKKSKTGFSLIETMVALSILLLLLDAGWMLYKNSIDNSEIFSSGLDAQMEVRKAFSSMTAWIRSASPSSTGAYTIAAASSTGFTFFSDIDSDGVKEKIRYFKSGGTIKQGITKPSGSPLAYNSVDENISDIVRNIVNAEADAVFTFYDKNYDGTTAPLAEPINISEVRLVKITFLIDKILNRPPAAMNFTTQVSIRSLKDNL